MDRRRKQFYSSLFSVCLALMCYMLALAVSNDNQHTWDLTANKRFSFSEQTVDTVKNLDAPVKLYAFLDPTGSSKLIEDTLDRYRRLNAENFEYEIVDLEKDPRLAEVLQVRSYGQGVLELVGSELTSKNKEPRRERVSSFDEAGITNALIKLLRTESRKVYFLTGHDEHVPVPSGGAQPGPENLSQWSKGMAMEGFESATLSLVESPNLPQDMDLLVLAGPSKDLFDGERKLIDEYIRGGGKMLFLAALTTPSSYSDWLAGYGFEIQDQVIIDSSSSLVEAEPVFSVGAEYSPNHPITNRFRNFTAFRLARPVNVGSAQALEGGGQPELEMLVKTPPTALIRPIEELLKSGSLSFESGAAGQSFSLAVAGRYPRGGAEQPEATPTPAAEESGSEKTLTSARLVVVGNADVFTNRLFGMAGNRDLALNIVNWLAESENQITVRVKDQKNQPLMLQKNQFNWLLFLFCVLIPFLSVLTGLLVVYQRRKGLAE